MSQAGLLASLAPQQLQGSSRSHKPQGKGAEGPRVQWPCLDAELTKPWLSQGQKESHGLPWRMCSDPQGCCAECEQVTF
jgi:hypothetical protein